MAELRRQASHQNSAYMGAASCSCCLPSWDSSHCTLSWWLYTTIRNLQLLTTSFSEKNLSSIFQKMEVRFFIYFSPLLQWLNKQSKREKLYMNSLSWYYIKLVLTSRNVCHDRDDLFLLGTQSLPTGGKDFKEHYLYLQNMGFTLTVLTYSDIWVNNSMYV